MPERCDAGQDPDTELLGGHAEGLVVRLHNIGMLCTLLGFDHLYAQMRLPLGWDHGLQASRQACTKSPVAVFSSGIGSESIDLFKFGEYT